jgi:hypothetical protein
MDGEGAVWDETGAEEIGRIGKIGLFRIGIFTVLEIFF